MLAPFGQRIGNPIALDLELAHFGILFLKRLARFDQLTIDQQSLVEADLSLGLEIGQRVATRFKLGGNLAAPGIELRQLGHHSLQGLLKRTQG